MERNLTTGSVMRTLLSFSMPYLLSCFLQTLYGMADLFITGQFCGVESITAVSVGSQAMHMLTVMIVGLSMGATVMIGRAVGAERRDEVSRCVGNTVTLFAAAAVVATAALLFAVPGVTALMSTPAEAVPGTEKYLTICIIGVPFITAYNVLSSILRGMGDSKSPMYFVAAACAANIGLDYLFIGGMGMGPAGAALGTTLSQTGSVMLALIVIRRRRSGIRLTRADLRPDRRTMRGILRIGVPIALQEGFIQISFIVITVLANRRGLSDSAAVGIVEKIMSALFLVPSAMLSSVSALAAQNFGAGKPERARLVLRYAMAISVGWGLLIASVTMLSPSFAVSLFTDDPTVIAMGGQYMTGYVWDCSLASIHFCFSGYFCACGRSGVSFAHNAASILLARVPLAYLASVSFPQTLLPMGLASAAGSLVSVTICTCVYIRMRKRERAAQPAK